MTNVNGLQALRMGILCLGDSELTQSSPRVFIPAFRLSATPLRILLSIPNIQEVFPVVA